MLDFRPTDEQSAILAHDPTHHARILAGPGTGKSTTMVALLDRLLNEDPDLRVRMLTFTRAATAELAEKVAVTCERAGKPSTVHSFAISLLLENPGAGGLPEPLRIADTWERKNIVRPTLAARAGVNLGKFDRLVQEMSSNWESLTTETDPSISDAERIRFRGAWTEHRRVFGYTLLSELPYALHRALDNHDDLDGINFDLLLVDEYQDLNACDLGVLKMLSQKGGCKVIGTGDDDQSIYSWRKAAPEGIRRFCNEYAGASDYPLSITLRCGRRIIEWANYVIQADPNRPADRGCLESLPGSPDGEVALLRFAGHVSEANGIADLVESLGCDGVQPKDILILMRTDHNGTFSAPIKKALEDKRIPCSDPNRIVRLLEVDGNRRLLEVFHLLANPEDSVSWASLVHLLRGVGHGFRDHIYNLAAQHGRTFAEQFVDAMDDGFPGAPRSSRVVANAFPTLRAWLAETAIPRERPNEGWGSWILATAAAQDWLSAPTPELRDLLVELDYLTEKSTLGRFLAQVEPLGKDLAQSEADGVRIMTMGGSKGLTVQAVIIAGAEDGLIPRPDSDLSEERRILYVAMTRATEYLFCTWAGRRRGPTARAGGPSLERRRYSDFLDAGPASSTNGQAYVRTRGVH